VYCEERHESYYDIKDGALRSDGNDILELPAKLSGKTVHTWLSFISENGKDIAPSIYTGQLTVA
jgi:hypothetical protein